MAVVLTTRWQKKNMILHCMTFILDVFCNKHSSIRQIFIFFAVFGNSWNLQSHPGDRIDDLRKKIWDTSLGSRGHMPSSWHFIIWISAQFDTINYARARLLCLCSDPQWDLWLPAPMFSCNSTHVTQQTNLRQNCLPTGLAFWYDIEICCFFLSICPLTAFA